MSDFDIGVAIEIVTNPKDLQFVLTKRNRQDDEAYGFVISRGPRYFKQLFTSHFFANTVDEALETLEELLETLPRIAYEALGADGGHLSTCDDDDVETIKTMQIMSKEMMDNVLQDLRKNGIASTFLMF